MSTEGEPNVQPPLDRMLTAGRDICALALRCRRSAALMSPAEKAHDKVAFAEQIAPFLGGALRVLVDRGQQELPQRLHPRDVPPVEHAAHQHEQRRRMCLQRVLRAFVQKIQHVFRVERAEQDAGVLLHDAQQGMIIAALTIGVHGVQVLPVLLVPRAEAAAAVVPALLRQGEEHAERALLHHMMKAVGHAVREAPDEGVLSGQRGEKLCGVPDLHDILRHFDGKLVGEAHHREELALLFGERVDHGGGKDRGDVGAAVGEHTVLGIHPQVQIDGGEPALAVIQQGLDLLVGKLGAAAADVDGELGMVEAELLDADLVDLRAQTDDGGGGQENVAAGEDEVDVGGETRGERTEEPGCASAGQQVEIVEEDIAGAFACQRVAQVLDQQAAARGVGRAVVVAQQVEAGAGEGVLHAPPEDGEVGGIDADADDGDLLGAGALGEVPLDRGGLAVAHRGDDGRQGAARDRAQAFLQALGYVDRVQVPFCFWHGVHLRRWGCLFHYNGFPSRCKLMIAAIWRRRKRRAHGGGIAGVSRRRNKKGQTPSMVSLSPLTPLTFFCAATPASRR